MNATITLGLTLAAVTTLGGCHTIEEPWQERLGDVVEVGEIEGEDDLFVVTAADLPAGAEGPSMKIDGWSSSKVTQTSYPRRFFGLRTDWGSLVTSCRWPLVLGVRDLGVVLFGLQGRDEEQAHFVAQHVLPWDHRRHDPSPYNRLQVLPIGVTLDRGAPTARAVVTLSSRGGEGPQVFDLTRYGDDGRVTHTWRGVETQVEPELADPRKLREALLFHVGDKQAFFTQEAAGRRLHVVDAEFLPLTTHDDARALRMSSFRTGDRWVVVRPAPSDPGLLWILGADGNFAPPPEAEGIVPAVHFRIWPAGGRVVGRVYVANHLHYLERPHWFVAYRTPAGRLWGTASLDLDPAHVTGPLFLEAREVESVEKARTRAFPLGVRPTWVVTQRIEDALWRVTDGVLEGHGPTLEEAFAAAEQVVSARNAEDARIQAEANRVWAAQAAAERKRQAQAFESATARNDRAAAFQLAMRLGGSELAQFLRGPLAGPDELREGLAHPTLDMPAEERGVLYGKLEQLARAERARKEAAERQARAAQEQQAWAGRLEGHRARWQEYRAASDAAFSANIQRSAALQYQHAMQNYRDGHGSLPR